jgi:formylglycine-generating enzyme required for sulfatase activity
MGNNPSQFEGDNHPVENVTWFEAVEFCNKRSLIDGLKPVYRTEGTIEDRVYDDFREQYNLVSYANIICDWNANGYRLPTEAEWEYAARGRADEYMDDFADDWYHKTLKEIAWFDWNSKSTTHPVGTKAPNSLGLHDMIGNVEDWCWDWLGDYPSGPVTNPKGPSKGSERAVRGGSYMSFNMMNSICRGSVEPYEREGKFGFRLARNGE